MIKISNKIIVLATITILTISLLLASSVFAESGVIQIQIRGAAIGDNLKISDYTAQDSWEWNDIFTIGENLVNSIVIFHLMILVK